jgi:hypothetical protein
MKLPRSPLVLVAFGLATFVSAGSAAETGFKSLFNGKDLTGWDGLKEFWSVRDGAITGQTTAEKPLKSNTFLIWQGGDVKNFELRVSFKLTAQNDNGFGNSGIQYRSKIVDAAGFVVAGYQADIDLSGRYLGMLYEEKGRGILMQPGQKVRVGPPAAGEKADKKGKQKAKVDTLGTETTAEAIAAAYKKGDWNEFVVIANGNNLRHYLNGKLTADVTDEDEANAAKSGVLALQLHQGTPMTIEFKNIRIKTLP